MTIGLKIKEVAVASGFTTAALRYYEQIGLLPEASRTPAGYRMYDERTLDRLAFIARAKQLGCSLEEITDLITAWDGGRCGPVQDQLRRLVADKIVAVQNQIAELATFTSELQHAATALERHRPDGACDSSCGCVSDPTDPQRGIATVQAVTLSTRPAAFGAPAIACTLSAGSMKGRMADWQSLLAHVERRERIDGGVRCVFAASVPASELIGLVTAEQSCCQFFRFAITVDTCGVALEVRSPTDAQSIVESLFGSPS
jgi:MerR family transcriptional regulator, copper efflux regulator